MRPTKHGALLLWLLAFMGGCDLAEEDLYALRITSPEDGLTFTETDDSDPATPGMQIALRVETTDDGVPIELLRLVGGAPEVITRKVTRDRSAEFPSVTLLPGANVLQAREARSQRTSLRTTLYFEDPCGSITFLDPAPPLGSQLLLGPPDGESCGENYLIPLLAATGLRDGTRVSVLVETKRVASGITRGGTLQIAEVPVETRNTPFALSLQVEDSHCSPVAFPAKVLVDCAGPTCVLNAFKDTPYTSADDPAYPEIPGLNLDISVETSADAANYDVMLVINGDEENASSSPVLVSPDGSHAEATFSGVPLPDGTVRVTAICRDDAGATTRSQHTISVDTSGCTVSFTSPLAGSTFVAAQDGDPLQISLTAALGSDCAGVRFSDSADAKCESLAYLPFQKVTLGQTTVIADLSLTVNGPRFLCVGTRDASENLSVVAIPITFENKGPSLTISSPAGALAINRDGDASHVKDLDPSTPACDRPVSVTCALEGKAVSLVRMPEKLQLAETPCVGHKAVFASVPFPSQNDGGSYQVEARTVSESGLIGRSPSLDVHADCEPPELAFVDLVCGVSAIDASADEDPAKVGIQYTLRVSNSPAPKPDVTLRLTRQGVPVPGSPITSDSHEGTDTVFALVTLPTGSIMLQACATDSSQNDVCTESCQLLVSE